MIVTNISFLQDCQSTPCKAQNLFAKGGTPKVLKSRDVERRWISKICPVKIEVLSWSIITHRWSFDYMYTVGEDDRHWNQPFLHISDCLHGSWTCTELSGHWRLFVLVSSCSYFFLATCARLSWALSVWVHLKLFFHILLYRTSVTISFWSGHTTYHRVSLIHFHLNTELCSNRKKKTTWGRMDGHWDWLY